MVKIRNLDNKRILLICHDADRGDFKEGLPYSKLLDSLHEELLYRGFNCYQISRPGSKLTGNLAWAKPLPFEGFFETKYLINKILNSGFNFFYKLMGFKIIFQFKFGKISQWKSILSKTNPKLIFVIGSTPQLCRAARALGIEVFEVLHGMGYHVIPWGWDKLSISELPSYILSMDSVSTNTFRKLCSTGLFVKEIPHLWYKRFTNIIYFKNLEKEWYEIPEFIKYKKKVILISLSWGYDGDHEGVGEFANVLENGLMPNELIEVINETSKDIFYCIRRHPVQQLSSRYEYQKKFLDELIKHNQNCEYIFSTQLGLVSLLKKVSGHITMSSMTSYDAALMGVKTLFLCPTLLKGGIHEFLFEDLINLKYAKKISIERDMILKWVNDIKSIDPLSLSTSSEQDWNKLLNEITK